MHSPFPSTAKRMSTPTRQGASSERGRSRGAPRRGWLVPTLVGTAAALGGAAIYHTQRARDAERRNPASGRFLMVDGVRLHYIVRGEGDPVVLIHGNGTMIQDFTSSTLVDRLAENHRVIV